MGIAFAIQRKLRKLINKDDPDFLFDGGDAVFKSWAREAKLYAEYGVGKSTRWMLANTNARIIAVDTDKKWVEFARGDMGHEDRLTVTHIDLGETGDWGRPVSDAHKDRFPLYTDTPWMGADKPDMVLVDGRFRVACFLTVLKHAAPGTRIAFDDYAKRPHYHVVEDYLKPVTRCGRQALFVVPAREALDMDAIERGIAQYRANMD